MDYVVDLAGAEKHAPVAQSEENINLMDSLAERGETVLEHQDAFVSRIKSLNHAMNHSLPALNGNSDIIDPEVKTSIARAVIAGVTGNAKAMSSEIVNAEMRFDNQLAQEQAAESEDSNQQGTDSLQPE